MDLSRSATTDIQKRVSQILDEYLTALESGTLPDEQAIMDANPDLHEYLAPHFSSLRMMHRIKDGGSNEEINHAAYEPPRELGDYVLRREIARGGMGIVFEATNKTLNRKVALKVLPFAAVLNQKQIDRFHNEAQAAARLHHPHIVPVYAVGVDRGVNYYAMQFIEGRSLSEALDELRNQFQNGSTRPENVVDRSADPTQNAGKAGGHLSTSPWLSGFRETQDRDSKNAEHNPTAPPSGSPGKSYGDDDYFRQVANLGVEVAGAMQHAHSLGIIHRDIKPSNLLVDQTGKTWVADFGLAHIPNDLWMTKTGDVLGTIRYMSPEQASGKGFVDHRTDIYSIGITLYELITLRPAFSCEDSTSFLRQIADVEPKTPRQINPAVPPDLENIVLKAISKDPADRYVNAADLENDLKRYLDGHPTLAKRPTLLDRTSKWARRHRRMVAAAVLGLCMLTTGSGIATVLLVKERAKTKAEQAKNLVEQEKTQASLEKAREIVDTLGVEISERLASIPGSENVRFELLKKTEGYYDALLEQSAGITTLDRSIVLNNAGKVAKQLGETDKAIQSFREARQLLESLPPDMPYQRELARCLNDEGLLLAGIGQIEKGKDRLDQALEIHTRLADELQGGETNLSVREIANIHSEFGCTQGNRAFLLGQLHESQASRQAYESAISWHRQALNTGINEFEGRRQLALCIHNLAGSIHREDPQLARKHCLEAIQIQKQLNSEQPTNTSLRSDLAISYRSLAGYCAFDKQWDQAIARYEDAIEIQTRLVDVAPAVVEFQSNLAVSFNNLGEVQLRSRRENGPGEALESFTSAEEILRRLVKNVPNDVSYQSSLGGALYNKGEAQLVMDHKDQAIASWRAGLAHQKDAVRRKPHVPQFQEFLAIQTRRLKDLGEVVD